MIKVGITGGIGSGKSTVCRLFEKLGVPVYDSDSRARFLQDNSLEIVVAIETSFGKECIVDGRIDRNRLASVVFSDPSKLRQLESIVHPVVRRDIEKWIEECDSEYCLIESAILFESGFDSIVDYTIAVLAPMELRIERAMKRDGSDREQVVRRISLQATDDFLVQKSDYAIVNINMEDVEKDVAELDCIFRRHLSK